jgi:hypothetical protein
VVVAEVLAGAQRTVGLQRHAALFTGLEQSPPAISSSSSAAL